MLDQHSYEYVEDERCECCGSAAYRDSANHALGQLRKEVKSKTGQLGKSAPCRLHFAGSYLSRSIHYRISFSPSITGPKPSPGFLNYNKKNFSVAENLCARGVFFFFLLWPSSIRWSNNVTRRSGRGCPRQAQGQTQTPLTAKGYEYATPRGAESSLLYVGRRKSQALGQPKKRRLPNLASFIIWVLCFRAMCRLDST